MHRVIVLLILLAPPIASAQVYKCQGADGATTYSDSPCGDDAAKLDIREDYEHEQRPEQAESRRDRTRAWLERREHAEEQRRDRRRAELRECNQRRQVPGVAQCPSHDAIRQAVRRNDVLHCMTRAEVQDAEPMVRTSKSRYNEFLASGISVEVWYYTRHRSTWPTTLYFRGGHVAAIEGFIE